MTKYKSDEEIELIKQSSLLVGKTIAAVAQILRPGITTASMDVIADEFIRSHGGVSAFKGFKNYPASIFVFVNLQGVHGIPGNYVLREGDVVLVDCGVVMNADFGDSEYRVFIGGADE